MILVGVVGFIGSGKGTAGEILGAHGFAKQSFAGPLKDAAAAMFGWDRKLLEGDTDRSRLWREEPDDFWSGVMGRPFTPREALQKLGTEAGRNVFHQDLWVKTLQKRLNCDTVITDVRFQNEMQFIRDNKGYIIHVQRGKVPDWYHTAADANAGDVKALVAMKQYGIHESEWKWIGGKIDHVIHNDGTLKEFETEVEVILQIIKRKSEYYETQQ